MMEFTFGELYIAEVDIGKIAIVKGTNFIFTGGKGVAGKINTVKNLVVSSRIHGGKNSLSLIIYGLKFVEV